MSHESSNNRNLLQEINYLEAKLTIAEETISVLQLEKADAILSRNGNFNKAFLTNDAVEPYRNMLESMNEGAVSVLSDGTIIYLNIKFAEMLSIDHKNAAGKNITDYLHKSQHSVFKVMLIKSLKSSFTKEFIIKNRLKEEIPVNISFHNLSITGSKTKALMLVVTNLSEIKKAHDKISESELKFRNVLNNSRDVIYEYSLIQEKYIYLSPSCQDIFGVPAEHLIGKDSSETAKYISTEHLKTVQDHFKKITRKSKKRKSEYYLEYEIYNFHGDKRWLANRHTILFNKHGKAESIFGNISDITFRKVAQEELKNAYELQKGYVKLLRTMQDALPAHIALLDKDGNIITVNESWRKFGEKNSLSDKNYGVGSNYIKVCEEATGDCSEEAWEAAIGIKKVLKSKLNEFTLEYPCHSPNENRWFRLIAAPISKTKNGGAVVMHVDITDRKLAEFALKESEFQYKRLFDEGLTGNYVVNIKGEVVLCNSSFVKLFGYKKKNDIINNPNFRMFSSAFSNIDFLKKLQNHEKIPVHEREIIIRNGQKLTVIENILGNYDLNGKLFSIQGYLLDITSVKDAHEKLQKKTNEIKLLYDAGKELSSTLDRDIIYNKIYKIISKVIPCNSMLIASFDSKSEKLNCVAAWLDNTKLDKNKFPEMPLNKSGNGMLSNAILSKKSFLLKNIDDLNRQNKKIIYINKNNDVKKKLKKGDKINKSALIVPMIHKASVLGVIQVLSYRNDNFTNDHLKLLETLTSQITAATINARLYEQAEKEIIERKNAEKALYKRTKELSLLYEAQQELTRNIELNSVYDNSYKIVSNIMPVDCMIISAYDKDDNMIRIRSVWAKDTKPSVSGIPPIPLAPPGKGIQSEVIRNGEAVLTNDFNKYFKRSIHKYTFTDNKPAKVSKSLYKSAMIVPLTIDGEVIGTIQVLSEKKNVYDKNDLKLLESLSISIAAAKANAKLFQKAQYEIEERIKKEEELQNIRKNLEEAQRIAHIGSWVMNIDTNRVSNSKEIYEILGIYPQDEEIDFDEAMKFIYEEDREKSRAVVLNAIQNAVPYSNEDRIIRPNGEIRYVKVMGEPILRKNGALKEIHGTMQDITDIKEINDKLVRSISEKELIIKEIHHRVKNNLQVVSSLLRLQSEKIKDQTIVSYFKQSEQRIKSMALIHQQLYRTKDLSNINFKDYINELCTYLLHSNRSNNSDISLDIEAEEIYFGIDTALPCGLIINELFTNALKHAFPDGKRGNITIKLFKDRDEFYNIIIQDDGIGAENLDLKNTTSLGMELVNTLTEQLDGSLILRIENGTEMILKFKEVNYKKRI